MHALKSPDLLETHFHLLALQEYSSEFYCFVFALFVVGICLGLAIRKRQQ